MKLPASNTLTAEGADLVPSLVERMDPAIGQATSMMGAVMQELLRQSLRGGVLKIGEELDSYVAGQVDATLTERKPLIEQTASEVAGKMAREVATEVAGQEVQAVESWAREATQELAGQMVEAERRTQQTTAEATQRLGEQIAQAEKRVTEAARTEMEQQVQDLLGRSRKGSAQWETRFKALEDTVEVLRKDHSDEINIRKTDQALLQQRLEREAKEQSRLQEEIQAMRTEMQELRQSKQDLVVRLAELEKPRGLKSKIAGWFGKGKEEKPEE